MRLGGVVDADTLMSYDIGPEEFEALTKAVGARLVELTGIPVEEAESLAVSVACCRIVDDDGNLVFRDADEREVVRLPYAAFADILDDDEEEEFEDPDSEEA
jgi:hypothetical protein